MNPTPRPLNGLSLRESFIDALPMAVYVCEAPSGVISYYNRKAAEFWGREPKLGDTEDRFCGAHRLFLPDGTPMPHDQTPMARCLIDGTPTLGGEVVIEQPSGRRMTVHVHITPVRDAAGRVVAAVNCFQDVSALKEAEARMQEANRRLTASNGELSQFAYVASHDLQEPLRKIIAYSERLQNAESVNPEYLERMRNAATRMKRLIEELLQYSRISASESAFQRVDLNALIAEVLSDLEPRIAERAAVFEVAEALPDLHGSAPQLRRLFLNLFSNAIKFTPPDAAPRISVRAVRPKDGISGMVRIEVQDRGIGFDEKYLDRIFKVFQRLHSGSGYEGSGIGLAICRKIVEQHGGQIGAKSAPGEGSTFYVTLPCPIDAQDDAHWRKVLDRADLEDHIVQFYDDEAFLAKAVAYYAAVGFRQGQAAVLIAVPDHIALFEAAMRSEHGLDAAELRASGRLLTLDAHETLSKFMKQGKPDWEAFHAVVGGALKKMPGVVRAYGEMVNILQSIGNAHAAIELEQFWNRLAKELEFSLFCAYSVHALDTTKPLPWAGVCGTHSEVIPAEDTSRLERAVEKAISDVLGAEQAKVLLRMIDEAGCRPGLPRSQHLILWIREKLPAFSESILVRAREIS